MASPVQLSDLPIATIAANDDLMLIRQGLTDYQIAVSAIRQIDLGALGGVPAGPVASDLMLISRKNVSTQLFENFTIQFCQAGFPKSTKMWFYNNLPPAPNWSVVSGTGDKLLAVATPIIGAVPAVPYKGITAGNQGGTWQQEGVGGGTGALTADQIPPHTHRIPAGKRSSGSSQNPGFARRAEDFDNDSVITSSTGNGTTGQTHNHGSAWRPFANVGVIGNKDF